MIERLSDEAIHNAAMILAPIFAQNVWKWQSDSTLEHIPQLGEIEMVLWDLAEDVAEGRAVMSETGRLVAMLDGDDISGHIRLFLELPTSCASGA